MIEDQKKPKRGDTNHEGLVFWNYQKGKQKWVSTEEFARLKEKAAEYSKNWYLKNSDKVKAAAKKWRIEHPEARSKHARSNKHKARRYRASDQYNHPDKVEYRKRKNRETYLRWKALNPGYWREKRKRDRLYAFASSLRSTLRYAFKRGKFVRPRGLGKVLGVSLQEAKDHIGSQFTEGMSWENYGKWHVDHIIPLASAKTKEDLIALCHYTNLQPLWARDNQRKRDKMPAPEQVTL